MERVSIPLVEERARRIVETAVELAEQGGFEAVRLRDVADQAGVALGTLYRRFRSKEELLVAALEQEAEELERRLRAHPARGGSAAQRVTAFFASATRGLCRRPNVTRAFLRAMTSGEPEVASTVSRFHERMTLLVTAALRGPGSDGGGELAPPPSPRERSVAMVLEHVWFSCLVGWAGGLQSQSAVVDQMHDAATLLTS